MILGSSTFLGLALAERSVAVAEVSASGGKRVVRRTATFALPAGVTIEQPEAAGRALQAFLRENKFSASRAVVGVPAKWLIARENDVPPAEPEQVRAMLSLAAERLSVAESSDLVTDFAGRIDGVLTGPRKVLLVAMLRQRFEQIDKAIDAAGLSLAAVTSSALVLAETARQSGGQDLPVLLLARHGAEMVFQHAGTPRMLRHLSVAAMNGHGVATGPLGTELRRVVALAPDAPAVPASTAGNGSHAPAAPGGREVLLWDAVGLSDEQLAELSDRMGVRVRPGDGLKSLGVQNGADETENAVAAGAAGQFAPAISLALAGADRGLLPVDFKRSRLAPKKKHAAISNRTAWGGILAALLVGGLVALYVHVQHRENTLHALDTQITTLKPEWEQAKKDRERLDYGLGFFEKRSPMLECVREVALVFPYDEQIFVTSFTVREDKDERKGKYVRKGTLIGKSVSQKAASDVADKLRANPKFADVNLQFQDAGGRTREVAFTIKFTFTASE
jgi:hypothetical protein